MLLTHESLLERITEAPIRCLTTTSQEFHRTPQKRSLQRQYAGDKSQTGGPLESGNTFTFEFLFFVSNSGSKDPVRMIRLVCDCEPCRAIAGSVVLFLPELVCFVPRKAVESSLKVSLAAPSDEALSPWL
eukprot:scaffold870_cov268-Pinguiococcus_pyrenoidosus.AAC.49